MFPKKTKIVQTALNMPLGSNISKPEITSLHRVLFYFRCFVHSNENNRTLAAITGSEFVFDILPSNFFYENTTNPVLRLLKWRHDKKTPIPTFESVSLKTAGVGRVEARRKGREHTSRTTSPDRVNPETVGA